MRILVVCFFATFFYLIPNSAMSKVYEIRSYNLKPGMHEKFDKLASETVLPMLKRWNLEVVYLGPSLHDKNSYFLVRAYNDVDHMNQSEDAFYGSDEWKKGPRESILSMIENFVTIVVSEDFFQNQLTGRFDQSTESDDLKALSTLNSKFIKNFITMDTASHNEVIHRDFVCIQNDGTIMRRNQYMKDWATDYKNANLKSFSHQDEFIRIFGNTALVRSKTNAVKMVKGKEVTSHTVYTDTYIKENGRWWCVQAQITPVRE